MQIALVEDDVDIVDFLVELLEDVGHVVTVYTTAEAGLDGIVAALPEVVIVDYNLPGAMQGDSLIVQLRAAPKTHDLPIILSSSNGPFLARTRQQWATLNVYVLPKPYPLDCLFRALWQAPKLVSDAPSSSD